ncbi:N4-gp56 family major capsid protein [Lysinibacillus sp. NPDC097214]|uniref:phage major capsid protein n=1 Tax=Lysinibacillus sp. NPDC097214 TaxID=3390584 RepID=UPI003D020C5A
MPNLTRSTDLFRPEVLGDSILERVNSKLQFKANADLDYTLTRGAGDTVTITTRHSNGKATELTAEGDAITLHKIHDTEKQYSIKHIGDGYRISKRSKVAGAGNVMEDAVTYIGDSISAKVNEDCVIALNGATKVFTATTPINFDAVVDASSEFEDEGMEEMILFIHPRQKPTVVKSKDFINNVQGTIEKAYLGELGGAKVVISQEVPFNDVSNEYTNFLVKNGALKIYIKTDVDVEFDRDIETKEDIITGDMMYVAALKDDTKVVKLITTK